MENKTTESGMLEKTRVEMDWETAKSMIDSLPYFALLVDEDHNIILVNEKVRQYLGMDMDSIRGQYCPKLIHGYNSPFPACPLEEVIEKECFVEREVYDNQHKRWLMSAIYPTNLITENGKAVFFHAVPDITAKKNAELGLKEKERHYRLLFNNANDAICVSEFREDGTIGNFIEVNDIACKLLGRAYDELLDLSLFDIQGTMNEVQFQSTTDTLLASRKIVFEMKVISRSKQLIPVEVNSNLIEVDGRPTVLSVIRDVTDRKQIEKERREGFERLRQSMESTIKAISMIVETRDPYTSGHQQRVSKLACAISREMNLSREQIDNIRIAGLLHDIGKISIPSEILSKPGRITDLEFEVIKAHPEVGSEILGHTEFPQPISTITLQHHERIDGSGYPYGLAGDDICIEAKIIGVADVIEAMSSRRPYREPLGLKVALQEIIDHRGNLYDPDVVDACQHIFIKQGLSFEALSCDEPNEAEQVKA